VHINSGIPNHVFYLAIEGGVNRVSGLRVEGVGSANRVQIETAFYRAVTQLLPASATFSMARAASIQAARDLYGPGSAAGRALTEAWDAVGVN
jgi:Zn-dependent metalloprotease